MKPNELRKVIREELMRGLGDFLYRPITETNKHNIECVVKQSLLHMHDMGYIPEVPPIRAIQLESDPTSVAIQYIDELGELRPLEDWLDKVTAKWYSVKMTSDSQ
jgi:hypothetical protein